MNDLVPQENIESSIFFIRGQKVMLDADLARLYGVSTKRLNQQAHRNIKRFPQDFIFQLTQNEYLNLRLQNATSSSAYGGRRFLPFAFTEQGEKLKTVKNYVLLRIFTIMLTKK